MRHLGVIGIGKLGICFALNAERKGWHLTGVDISKEVVDAINQRTLISDEPFVEDMLGRATNLVATTEISAIYERGIRLVFVFVATPSLPDGSYDHSQLERVADRLEGYGKRNHPVDLVIGCTTMPGYCDKLAERLEPLNYIVSYCPEFIAQGSIITDQLHPDQVLIGEGSHDSGDIIEDFFADLCESEPQFCRMDRLSAEIAKIATNCFLTTKISFANSIGDLALKAGATPDAILDAIGADSRIGPKYLRYGYGFGGPCFPRDNRALGRFADNMGYELLLSKATDEVNQRHLDFQFEEAMKTDGPLVFDHVSFKKGSSIIEESQQLALAVRLAIAGRDVEIRDTASVIAQMEKLYPGLFRLVAVGDLGG